LTELALYGRGIANHEGTYHCGQSGRQQRGAVPKSQREAAQEQGIHVTIYESVQYLAPTGRSTALASHDPINRIRQCGHGSCQGTETKVTTGQRNRSEARKKQRGNRDRVGANSHVQ
jgi:hypothetical protein